MTDNKLHCQQCGAEQALAAGSRSRGLQLWCNSCQRVTSYRRTPPIDDLPYKLETIGDAVVLLLAREFLYQLYPRIHKRKWTRIVWLLVSNAELNALAGAAGLTEPIQKVKSWKGLASAFEAELGRLYLQDGLEAARSYFWPLMAERFDIEQMAANWQRDAHLEAVYRERGQAA